MPGNTREKQRTLRETVLATIGARTYRSVAEAARIDYRRFRWAMEGYTTLRSDEEDRLWAVVLP